MIRPRQQGMTLVEVLVGITISLVLLFGMTSVLLNNRETLTAQTNLQRYQEDTRMANIILANTVQNAGAYGAALVYNNLTSTFQDLNGTAISAADLAKLTMDMSAKEDQAFNGEAIISSPSTNSSVSGTFPHSITVRYKSNGQLSDCLGNVIGSTCPGEIAANTFTVNASGQLTCGVTTTCGVASTVTAAMPLVDNIENMAVRYGLDSNHDGSIDQFVWPNQVSDWEEVLSVQINLLAASVDNVNPVSQSTVYFAGIGANGGSGLTSATDNKVRREFSVLIPIHRRLHSAN